MISSHGLIERSLSSITKASIDLRELMADPVSLALAIAPLLIEAGKLIKSCNEAKAKYKYAPDTLDAIVIECNGVSHALVQAQTVGHNVTGQAKEQQITFYNAIDSVLAGCSASLTNIHQQIDRYCETEDGMITAQSQPLSKRDKMQIAWDEDAIDRQLQRLRGYQTNLSLCFTILHVQSDNSIRQLVEMQGTVLTTLFEQSRQGSKGIRRMRTQETISSTGRLSIDSTASSVLSNTSFDFDNNVLDSTAYRIAFERRLRGHISRPTQIRTTDESTSMRAVASVADDDSYLNYPLADDSQSEVSTLYGPLRPPRIDDADVSDIQQSNVPTPESPSLEQSWTEYNDFVSETYGHSIQLSNLTSRRTANTNLGDAVPALASRAEALLVSKAERDADTLMATRTQDLESTRQQRVSSTESFGSQQTTGDPSAEYTATSPPARARVHFSDDEQTLVSSEKLYRPLKASNDLIKREGWGQDPNLGPPNPPKSSNTQVINILVIGDEGRLKTRLLMTYVEEGYLEKIYVRTIYDNFFVEVRFGNILYKLKLANTAGMEDYDTLRPLYYHGKDVYIICASLASNEQYENALKRWAPELRAYNKEKRPVIFAGIRPGPDHYDEDDPMRSRWEIVKVGDKMEYGKGVAKEMGAISYLETDLTVYEDVKAIFDTALIAATKKRTKSGRSFLSRGLRRIMPVTEEDE